MGGNDHNVFFFFGIGGQGGKAQTKSDVGIWGWHSHQSLKNSWLISWWDSSTEVPYWNLGMVFTLNSYEFMSWLGHHIYLDIINDTT